MLFLIYETAVVAHSLEGLQFWEFKLLVIVHTYIYRRRISFRARQRSTDLLSLEGLAYTIVKAITGKYLAPTVHGRGDVDGRL